MKVAALIAWTHITSGNDGTGCYPRGTRVRRFRSKGGITAIADNSMPHHHAAGVQTRRDFDHAELS